MKTITSMLVGALLAVSVSVIAQVGGSGVTNRAAEFFVEEMLAVGPTDVMTINGSAIASTLAVNSDTLSIYESHTHADSASGAIYYGAKSRGSTGSESVVQNNDQLAAIYAVGHDGTDYAIAGRIDFAVDGTPGSNDMPGEIRFWTTADGASTSTLRMTIAPDGTPSMTALQDFSNDSAACSGGLVADQLYHNSGVIQIVQSCE